MRWSNIIIVTLLLTGCASRYHEPARSANLAILHSVSPVWVKSIDGKRAAKVSVSGERDYAVAPGHHLIEVEYAGREGTFVEQSWFGSSKLVSVWKISARQVFLPFTAEAGGNYFIHDGRFAESWQPYISEHGYHSFLDVPAR